MSRLEELISKHREKFDWEEPSSNHEFNFEKKLHRRFHRTDKFTIRYAVAIAASVAIFIATTLFIYKTKTEGYTGAVETSQWIEFLEAEQYYAKQNETAYLKLKEALNIQTEDVSSPIYSEFKEMDRSYKQLKNDLKDNPNDIRLMSAVVQYHQLKLDLINNLIERFTLYSNIKIKKNEKSNI
jgi:hypothetical protein